MSERISWKGDKKVYQPRIKSERIHELHELSVRTGKPQTVLIEEALGIYLAQVPQSRPDIDDLIDRQEEITGQNYNQWDDPEDLGAYLEPYQNG
jgi:hypothetical protein